METQRQFGRRTVLPPAPPRGQENARAAAPRLRPADEIPVERAPPPPRHAAAAQVDDELREWKQARRRAYRLPWRQLALMASLCFGIGALVLPDTVNENLDWLLYALMAASFYAGIRRRSA
jgi:hypothetical protein